MSFLRNSWYCAGWAHELEDGPKGIRMLNEYIVLYRKDSGQLVAMTGRCPHRFAPLDQGEVIDDAIVCPYHGLKYSSDGSCIHNPHGEGIIPPKAKLNTYVVTECNSALWVWMGDPDQADSALLPEETALMSDQHSSERLYLNLPVNYQLIVDNLLDLTHAPYLHRATLASGEGLDLDKIPVPDFDFKKDGDVLHSYYHFDVMPPSPQLLPFFSDSLGEFNAKMTWKPASILSLDLRMDPLEGGKSKDIHMPTEHYITPETETSTHYFASVSRNRDIHNPESDTFMKDIVTYAFTQEDEPMIIRVQDLMGDSTDIFEQGAVILQTDVAGVQARRILKNKIIDEQAAEK